MSIEFYKKLSLFEEKDYIENFLVYSLSPVIAGLKPASTVTLKRSGDNLYDKWVTYGQSFTKKIGLDFIELRESKDALVVMIFSEMLLKKKLHEGDSEKFLMDLGYFKSDNICNYLENLKLRYDLYKCPHELGLFLGIPIKDVRDFMKCTDKKCLMCGYWKVYNDHSKAQIMFSQYDRVRKNTIEKVLMGEKSYDLAFNLKSFLL